MKVEFSVRACGLKNVAGPMRKSDPYAVVTNMQTEKPTVLGKTETIDNTVNPEWCHVFIVDYELGIPTKLVVSIFDEQSKKSMGSAIFDVGELLGARGNTKAKKLKKIGGTIFAHVRKSEGSGVLRMQLAGKGLKNTEGFLRKSDPFFEISRRVNSAGGQTWDNIYRSKPVKDSLDPAWEGSVIDLPTLCGGNLDQPVKISVYDYESSGKHVLMGACETSVNALVEAGASSTSLELKSSSGDKPTGQIVVTRAIVAGVEEEAAAAAAVTEKMGAVSLQQDKAVAAAMPSSKPTFLDYVMGGCELNVVVAIDFTGSNGDPRKPGTLHHIDDATLNPYEKAIKAIVEILAKYDSDQKFPVLGFGAKYNGVVQHCFQCGAAEESHGVAGVLEAYHSVFKTGLIMSSPTVFTEVMQTAAARARSALEAAQRNGKQAYTMLLVLTDGAVSDVDATAECLKEISDSPLSVVIVGVGDADFSSMEFLDDHATSAGTRDLAQFVQFNKHAHSPDNLTSVTLREIPEQLTGYFQSKNIQPNPPITTDEAEIIVEDEEEEIDLSLDVGEDEIVVTGGTCQTRSW